MLKPSGREIALAATIALLILLLFVFAPTYFSRENLADLFLENMPVMVVSLGMTLTILIGQIDISVGSIFAAVARWLQRFHRGPDSRTWSVR